MKKIIVSAFLLTALLGNIHISAQSEAIGLQKYDYVTNGDTNMYQGIPNIGFPLFNIAIPTTGTSISLSVNYNTESVSAQSLISDVGKGWNLSGIGSVIRNRTRDYRDYNITTNGNEAFSDVYNYSYPGGSGKFYIGMDTVSHELKAVHTEPSNDKISLLKDPAKPNKILSFKIIDTKGNQYIFDKVNINKMQIGISSEIENPSNTKLVNSCFYLSKILNVKNEEVASIEYETFTQEVTPTIGSQQQQKIKKINVSGTGSIEYLYKANEQPHYIGSQRRDWYVLDKLVLKDTGGRMMNQYAFNNGIVDDYFKKLSNLDKNNQVIQEFNFEYDHAFEADSTLKFDAFGYPNFYDLCNLETDEFRTPNATNRNTVTYGSLKRIILPTGGSTEYEFESNAVISPTSTPNCFGSMCYYDNYEFNKIYTLDFDTKYATQYPISLPSGYQNKVFVKYDYILHSTPPAKPNVDNSIVLSFSNGDLIGDMVDLTGTSCAFQLFSLPSTTTAQFSGYRQGHGTLEIYAAKTSKKDNNQYGHGLRIKSIKNFNPGSYAPVSYTKYEYDNFNDPLSTSGEVIDYAVGVSLINAAEEVNFPVGYTNIKSTNMIDGSYSKYYFADPQSLTTGTIASFASMDNDMSTYLRMMGLLKKKEDYSASGQLLQKTEMDYQLKDVVLNNITTENIPVKKINISRQSSTTETYISGTSKKLVSSSETNVEDQYNNVSSTKETLSDGTIIEKTFLYPQDKGVQKLLNANMVNIPLETSTKRNGKLVGKAETKFEDASHLYPTSVISYNMQTLAPVTASTLDVYDSKGNLVQTTGKNGIPVTTIWGYYQSQPIAVISGASYAQVASLATVTAAITASNGDRDDPSQEPQLLTALENLRKDPALQNYTVTATTYDPMIGVTNSISANGIRTVNVYDAANRLIKTTDAAGKTLQEYQYNYKH